MKVLFQNRETSIGKIFAVFESGTEEHKLTMIKKEKGQHIKYLNNN